MIEQNIRINHIKFKNNQILSFAKQSKLSTKKKYNQKMKIIHPNKEKNIINIIFKKYFNIINCLLFYYILFSLPRKIKSYNTPENYIILKVGGIGEQQIISDLYDIDKFKPYRIFINEELQIMRDKKVPIKSINDIIKIEWLKTNPNLTYMFADLKNIETIILNNMLNSNNNNLSYMFYNCLNLKNFTYIGPKTIYCNIKDTSKMFYNCFSLISASFYNYYQANDINMSYMFYNCQKLNKYSLASSNKVNDMRYMFYKCYSLESIDLSKFSLSDNAKDGVNISYLFYDCYYLNSFSQITPSVLLNDMRFMFYNCTKIKVINLNNFKINNSINMSYLFFNCRSLNNLRWENLVTDLSKPSDLKNMFYNCFNMKQISLPFSNQIFDINMTRMFYNCYQLNQLTFDRNSQYYPNDMQAMFYNCTSFKKILLSGNIITDSVRDMSFLFYNCHNLTSLKISFSNSITKDMRGLFLNCKSLSSLDLSDFYTPKVEIMWEMFKGCSSLTSLDLITLNTSKVKDMESMFEGCSKLTSLNLNNFITSNVEYMNKMFRDCISLQRIDFRNIKTDSVGTMHQMFYNCNKLVYLDLYYITENGQSYEEMFDNASNNFQFCIKENEDIPNIFEKLLNIQYSTRDCSESCYGTNRERLSISEKKLCCRSFKYKDNCYDKCPGKTKDHNGNKICQDFNCTGEKEYYNYEQSECTKDIRGYYINDSFAKTIDKCHEDCAECKGRWTNESSQCSECKISKPYIYLGNCYENCTPGFYQDDKSICRCFNKKCELCSEDSLQYDLCITCNKDYFQIENDPTNHYPWINCYFKPEKFFLSNNIYKPCFHSCEYCLQTGNYENHYCITCDSNNTFALPMDEENLDSPYNCYPNCSFYYYFDEKKIYHCTENPFCPQEYSKLINGTRQCVKTCFDTKKTKYEYQYKCYDRCPPEISYNLNDTDYFCKITCPFEEPFEMVEEQICVSNCTIMERKDKLCVTNYRGNRSNNEVQDKVLANLQDDIIDTFDYHYINENVSIVLEEIDNTYEIVTTNKFIDESKTSFLKLGECENTLKSYYSINQNDPLYLLKLDAFREGMQNPKVIYLVYYPLNGQNLEQLDLTLCEGDGVSLLFSANLTDDEDLYNKNSGYYNDICYTYTSDDGTDISLIDRQQEYIDNNKSLCEEECEFIKYNEELDKTECSCNVKVSPPLVSELKIDKSLLYKFVDMKKIANFDVMKCYFLLSDTKSLAKNIGIYIYLPAFISYFICMILFYRLEYSLVKANLNEIVTAKINLKYLLECGIANENLNNNIHYYYDDDPAYLIKMKNMKLSNKLRNRNIKNISNIAIPKKPNIKIKRKIKIKKLVLRKDLKVQFKNEAEREEISQANNNFINYIKINLPKENYNKTDIKKSEIDDKNNIKNTKNAPPNKLKRSIKNDRNIQRNRRKEILEFSSKKNMIETTVFHKDEEDKNGHELDIIQKYKGNMTLEERENIKTILKFNNNELNSMDYKEALQYDHRSFFSYYFALLKSKHIIITLIENKDYNSRAIKIFLIFLNFASCYAINALFFDDDTMHKIYEDKGNYNFLSQLPQIIYSTIIGYFFDNILNFLALSEDDIISLKQEKEIENLDSKKRDILKILKTKFIIFFIFSFLLLSFFWYYTTCFCAVYKNTQIHLLKDSLISFATSMGTPFIVCFFTTIFRIWALKKKKKSNQIIYGLSKLIQFF